MYCEFLITLCLRARLFVLVTESHILVFFFYFMLFNLFFIEEQDGICLKTTLFQGYVCSGSPSNVKNPKPLWILMA